MGADCASRDAIEEKRKKGLGRGGAHAQRQVFLFRLFGVRAT